LVVDLVDVLVVLSVVGKVSSWVDPKVDEMVDPMDA